MSDNKTFYISTPIYYPSGKAHIGHSYTTVAADAISRYKRANGYDVFFLTGTDEHGQKIEGRAKAANVTPKQFVDEIVAGFKEVWSTLDISYDKFIRTTDDYHESAVKKIFKTLYDKGDIYKGKYSGLYCTPCESFWTETQLKDGKCPDCGREVRPAEEEAYFFRLSDYADRILRLYEENPEFIQPASRKNEMVNFIKGGLEDLCVSRTTITWGIPVDFDPGHVIYVWIDALTNYITALGYSGDDTTLYDKFWPAQIHFVGKEIVRFHTVIWPAILMALELPLPERVYGHGWVLMGAGEKMSKSKGNVVDPIVLSARYGSDAIRYFLLREIPFGSDGNFTNEALCNRINSDLANDLGNLVSRTTAMAEKYFGGTLITQREDGEYDLPLITMANEMLPKVDEYIEKLQFSNALAEIWKLISRANKYIDETMPWALAKEEDKKARLATVLYNLAECLRMVSVALTPFLPKTGPAIQAQIGATDPALLTMESARSFGKLPLDVTMHKGETLFPRIDVDKEIAELDEQLAAAQEANSTAAANSAAKENAADTQEKAAQDSSCAKEQTREEAVKAEIEGVAKISIDHFAGVELRVARVLSCEGVKRAKKLLKLTLDDGTGTPRTVVSGIAQWYKPEDLIGHCVIVVANLNPATLCGVESNGMILAADDGDNVSVIFADGVAAGSKVR
jgi:methionyl-tRNA synthetase